MTAAGSTPGRSQRSQITSTRSSRVAQIRRLHQRRHRAERGAFVVEGPPSVLEALAHATVREVYATEAILTARPDLLAAVQGAGLTPVPVSDEVVRAMSETESPQGVIAVCDLLARSWEQGLPEGARRLVVLEGAADPGNAGTIIRTADAAGVDAVVLSRGSVDPHNGKCVRATAGSLFHIPIVMGGETAEILSALRDRGITCLGADAHGEIALGSPESSSLLQGPHAWVFGSEAHGLTPDTMRSLDARIAIPLRGGAESLNLAAAAAICLYSDVLRGDLV